MISLTLLALMTWNLHVDAYHIQPRKWVQVTAIHGRVPTLGAFGTADKQVEEEVLDRPVDGLTVDVEIDNNKYGNDAQFHMMKMRSENLVKIQDEESRPPFRETINGKTLQESVTKDTFGPVFVPEDVNNPTKVEMPKDGFPPQLLPETHRNAALLQEIRNRSIMTPRWPRHPGMHSIELRSYGPAYSSIVISHVLKVIYVPVFKVGTTSMMWSIAYLENNTHVLEKAKRFPQLTDYFVHDMGSPGWQNHTIFNLDLEEIREYFENPEYLKFGFVRNPFDRVVSAYCDKILSIPNDRLEYQAQMYSLYGDDEEQRKLRNETKPSFQEYLEAVEKVLEQPRTKSNDLWNREAYEDNRSRRDLHWRPQVELLHPDLIHLDFLGRFENLKEDQDIVFDWMYRHTDRRMPVEMRRKRHSTKAQKKVKLYQELRENSRLRDTIFKIYSADFERFQFPRHVPDLK